jgi:hypothetical protein
VTAATTANGFAAGQTLNGFKSLNGRLGGSTTAQILLYDGTTAIVADGDRYLVKIEFEAA